MPRLTAQDKAKVVEKTISLLPSQPQEYVEVLIEAFNRLSFNQLAILQSAIESMIMNNCQDLAKSLDPEEVLREVKNFEF